jgi:serine/threonine protein kinase
MAARRRAPVRLTSLSGLGRLLAPHGLTPLAPVQRRPFSLVFPATEAATGDELFVKLLTSRSEGVRRNFGCEIDILRTLAGHPGIKKLRAASDDDSLLFHACEPVRGQTLRQLAGAPHADLGVLLGHTRELARWVAGLHGQGIAHGDLSPDHVFVEQRGGLVVVDFGMARQTRELPADQRRQCEGCDVQALGMILWEMICESPIFPYRGRTLGAVLEREAGLVREAELPIAVRRLLMGCFAASSEFTPEGLPPYRGFTSANDTLRAFDAASKG